MSKRQPKNGDWAVHCGHVSPAVPEAVHWYESPEDALTLTVGEIELVMTWIIICVPCVESGIDGQKLIDERLIGGNFKLTEDKTIQEIH